MGEYNIDAVSTSKTRDRRIVKREGALNVFNILDTFSNDVSLAFLDMIDLTRLSLSYASKS